MFKENKLVTKNFLSSLDMSTEEVFHILEIAKKVSSFIDAEIEVTDLNDPRSYRQDSTKLLKTGFKPKYGIDEAIMEISAAFRNNSINKDDSCYTVKWMKKLDLDSK